MSDKVKKDKHTVVGTGVLLWKASNAWQRHVREQLKSIEITQVQFLLLDAIQQHEATGKQLTQISLSRSAGTDVMMTSKVIRAMEVQKLVVRKSSKKDARIVVLQITAEGKKKLSRAAVAMEKAESAFFSKLISKPHKFLANLAALVEENQG